MAKGSKVLTEDDFPDYAELMGILERTDKAYCKERKENTSLREKLAKLREYCDQIVDDREDLRLEHENLNIAHEKLKLAHEQLLREHEELKAMPSALMIPFRMIHLLHLRLPLHLLLPLLRLQC